MFHEVWTQDFPVTFDGLVVEAFNQGSDRWHITQILEIRLDEGKKGLKLLRIMARPNGGFIGVVLPDSSIPAYNAMLADINRARAERYQLPPVKS